MAKICLVFFLFSQVKMFFYDFAEFLWLENSLIFVEFNFAVGKKLEILRNLILRFCKKPQG